MRRRPVDVPVRAAGASGAGRTGERAYEALVTPMRRDSEALRLASSRSFAGAFVAACDLELQARRLTLRLYGTLGGGNETRLGTLTCFGVAGLALENSGGAFPQSVRLESLNLAMPDPDDAGSAELVGTLSWRLTFAFDGLAYEEHPALLASLADDL